MVENLLSVFHIQKLGHPIEEIRLRALSSVISKYNLNLVDENNLENTKLLIKKLLDWFDFEKIHEEQKVLSLLLKILKYKNVDLMLKELDKKTLLRQVNKIEKRISRQYHPLIQEIINCITSTVGDTNEDHHGYSKTAIYDEKPKINGKGSSDIYEYSDNYYVSSPKESKKPEENFHVENLEKKESHKCRFRIELFPWQHLTPGDKQALSSIYNDLRYIDNKNSILKACQFFNEVLLRDFPVEIFLQRPSIVKTFLQLIEHTGEDIRIPVLKCLFKTIQCLEESMKVALNTALFNTKKEFNTTTAIPTSPDEPLNFMSTYIEDFHLEDNNFIDPNLKKYQLSVPQFCFDIVLQTLPHLGKKHSQEETNHLLNLVNETLNCLIFNLNSEIWTEGNLRTKFYKIFIKLYEVLKFQKTKDPVVYIIVLYFTVKLLKSLNPPSGAELSELLLASLQSELGSCICDPVLVLLFPQLHSEILKWAEKLLGQKEKDAVHDYKDVLIVMNSMKFSKQFLNSYGKVKTRMEALEWMQAALPSLDFHENVTLVQSFVKCCLLKWRKSQLNEEELKTRDKILLKLLAHCNDSIKTCTYKEIHRLLTKLLGWEEAKTPRFDFPGDQLDFLFRTEILTEIICHGLSSSLETVRKYSSEIVIHLLKSKFVTSEASWSDFTTALIPCLSLLQCYADKSTVLGRCVVKMFDPDVAKCNVLPQLEVLKGNMRFLFSKNNLTRDEALSRLFWLLTREDRENKKLPRMIVLAELNLSGICSSVKPKDFAAVRHSFYSPARLSDVLEMLGSEHVEPKLKRSALSQIAVMMDDHHLHQTFLEQKGLEKILEILDNCLVEREYRNYPDSVKSIIDILKALAFQHVRVRQELTGQAGVLFNILRGLFLFSSDDELRQNAVELICLLLYSDCILRVPSDLSVKCTVSFPELVVNRMCLPFLTHVHWRNSRHLEPSVKKTLMSKANCSKLIRFSWAIQWVGSLSDILSTQPSDLSEKTSSPGLPDDMKVTAEDVESVTNCSFNLSVKRILYDIQNAVAHETVFSSLEKLQSYFLLYNINKGTSGEANKDLSSDTVLCHMLWESTLERFMTAQPSCSQDEALLLQVIRLVQLLLRSFKSDRLIDWAGKFLVDEHQPLIKLLKNIGNEDFGLVGKELRLAVVELTQQIVTSKAKLDRNKWFAYLELISDHLTLEKNREFYNVAYVDWFLCLLVDLTGKWAWNFVSRTGFLEKLITRITEMIIGFHCTKDSAVSFLGSNIIRSALLVLNFLTDSAQGFVKDWEKVLFKAFSKVVGQERHPNYFWMLSLWFTRDPFTRSAAYRLLVGFSATSLSCDLLLDQMKIQFEHVWSESFKTLFDENECSFVREKAALLLSNLTGQGTTGSCENFLGHLRKINFYEEVRKILSNYDCSLKLEELRLHETDNRFTGQVVTTPSFVTSICALLSSITNLNQKEVSCSLLHNGIISSFINVLGEVPESANLCGSHELCADVLKMYAAVCQLLTRMVLCHGCIHSLLFQSQLFISSLFSMVNYELYCDQSCTVTDLRVELWTEIFDLFSALLGNNENCRNEANKKSTSSAFVLINKSMSDNGVDQFISSLYLSMISDDVDLRFSAFKFFTNLVRHELNSPKHISIADVFERKIPSKALKLATTHSWKALKISENPSPNFGVRTAEALLQVFLLSTSCNDQASKTTIADCLGSLLAVCQPAKDFCVEKGLPESLISNLKQICVKLNLENVENLKKSSTKKKINPLLSDSETLFKLICNLVHENERAKSAVADTSLSTVMFSLWPWCLTKQSLLCVALKMLCTFTHSCDPACRTLTLSGSLGKLGLKKSPGSATLINSVMNQVAVEMDLISDSHDSQTLRFCLQLLTNCCRMAECRSVVSKGNFLSCFCKFYQNRKKRSLSDGAVESWLRFFMAFSAHPDGQLALAKNQDLLDVFIKKAATSKSSHRITALSVLRNICFQKSNRLRMLGYGSFLSLMCETLNSSSGEEVQIVAVTIWALACNSQKAKLILRSSGFESKLVNVKRRLLLTEDTETADLIEVVSKILKNK